MSNLKLKAATATISSAVAATKLVAAANAVGGAGSGLGTAGVANAHVDGSGLSGTYLATASTSNTLAATKVTQPVASVSASAGGNVDGTVSADAGAAIAGGAVLPTITSDSAIAEIVGAPSASGADVANALSNSNIATAFGASTEYFGVGEIGGGSASAASTSTASISETVNLADLTTPGTLVLGLYDGAASGSGVTGVTFDLFVNGVDKVHQSFSSGAAAQAYFTNDAVSTGVTLGNTGTVTLQAVLTVTTTPGSGPSSFVGDVILGDPPAGQSRTGAAVHPFVQAMAELGGGAAASHSTPVNDHALARMPLLARTGA